MTYHGRSGPNITEYVRNIDNLNEIPDQDIPNASLEYDMEADLAMFTNTNFYDFELGAGEALPVDGFAEHIDGEAAAPNVDIKSLEFTQGDYTFPDYNFTQPQSFVRDPRPELPAPIQTQSLYGASSAGSPIANGLPTPTTDKRKGTASSPAPDNYEEASRVAAEEDKRRRNTAASARFRVKKKQREQALERSAKEMADKVAAFEARIAHLEMENKWLKNLITERNEGSDDVGIMYTKYISDHERKGVDRKDGVGTKTKA